MQPAENRDFVENLSMYVEHKQREIGEQRVNLPQKGVTGWLNKKGLTSQSRELNRLERDVNKVAALLTNLKNNPSEKTLQAIQDCLVEESISDLPEGELSSPFTAIPVSMVLEILEANRAELPTLDQVHDGTYHYKDVLDELDRLKDRLGGSPAFGDAKPSIVREECQRTIFGTPISAIKEKFRQILDLGWKPQFFWRPLAKAFGVTEDNKPSQYEDAHIRIQRFGMVAANRDRLFEILDTNDTKRYGEIRQIAGLFWHPDLNPPNMEKEYILLIDLFLTEHFQNARAKGDDALVEFFNALHGLCFEARARAIEAYIIEHSGSAKASDWDATRQPVKTAYTAELMQLNRELADNPNPVQLRARLEELGVFDKEFQETDGKAQKPSLETYHLFALEQMGVYTMVEYTYEDFLLTELEIFSASNKDKTRENFKAHLQDRLKQFSAIELHLAEYPARGELGEPVVFDLNSEITQAFLEEHTT